MRNSENENRPSYALLPEKISADSHVLSINENSVLDFLDIAIQQTYLLLNNETFYICDLSKGANTPYNTLVFQVNGAPLKSVETTTQIINRYFKYICVDYKSMMQLGKSLGTLRHCPFVLGSLCFTPLHGASKKHVSWIALHNVQDITAHQKATHYNIDSRHELLLDIPYKKYCYYCKT